MDWEKAGGDGPERAWEAGGVLGLAVTGSDRRSHRADYRDGYGASGWRTWHRRQNSAWVRPERRKSAMTADQ